MESELLDTWNINNRINLYLLAAIVPEALRGVPVGMKGRSVGEIFAHLHNVRLLWLEQSPKLMDSQQKIPLKSKADKEALSIEMLHAALTQSARGVEALFQQGIAKGKISGCKPHLLGCFGYFLAHEAYHRGEICMTLTQAGHKLPDEVLYGQWEWGAR